MRKIWLTALCLSALLWCTSVYAEDGPPRVTKDGVIYEVYEDRAVVVDFDQEAEVIALYDQIEGLPISHYPYTTYESGEWHPRPPANAREVVLAEGITRANGICGWPKLERISWASTLTEIDGSAFSSCPSLREVHIPEGVTHIGMWSFMNCEGLTRVTLPSTAQEAGYAFGGCSALTAFEVASNNPFFETVEGVVYRKSDKALALYPFGKPDEEYIFPSGVLSILPGAFTSSWNSTYALKRLQLPEGWTAVGELPNSLEELWIPASITQIDSGSLPRSSSLRKIHIAPENPAYRDVNGEAVVTSDGKTLVWSICSGAGLVPQGVESIPFGIFYSTTIETVSIPRSVTRVDPNAFAECHDLRAVSLPITLDSIGIGAFQYCIALESLALPPKLTFIGESAFYNCTSLRSITIPDSVITIEGNPFIRTSEDFTIYANQNTAGFWTAWVYNLNWAEPGGTPMRAREAFQRKTEAAVVNNKKATDILNLRAEPNTQSKILGSYQNGTTGEVLDVEGTWAHVLLGDLEGYMSTNFLFFTDPLTHQIEIHFGRRAGKDKGGPFVLYALPAFDASRERITEDVPLYIVNTIGIWYQVVCQGRMGYVQSQDLVVGAIRADGEEGAWFVVVNPSAGDRLHLRAEPSASSKSLGQYFNGTQVKILDNDPDSEFLHVRVDGKEGYMMRKFLRQIEFSMYEDVLWGNG